MRTTLNIDGKLLKTVVDATGEKTKSKAVNTALKEYIRRRSVEELFDYWRRNPMSDDDYHEYQERKKKQLEAQEERWAFLESLRDGTA